jgi:hypothetical protein
MDYAGDPLITVGKFCEYSTYIGPLDRPEPFSRQKRSHGDSCLAESARCREYKLHGSEISRVLVRFDHVANFIVNANHGIV